MAKIDIICRRLRDIAILLIGVAAVLSCAYLIYERSTSPEREMQRAMQRAFSKGMDQVKLPITEIK